MLGHFQRAFVLLLLMMTICLAPSIAQAADNVIVISVDGLRPDAVTSQGAGVLPNFYRLRTEGAFTDNARTDFDFTVTLPNHTSIITGRPVNGLDGHNWTLNSTPSTTIHDNKGAYVAGMFDVAHDAGLSTALYASKSKFGLFDDSYDADSGAAHANGADKIDRYFQGSTGSGADQTGQPAVDDLLADMAANTRRLAMLHIRDPDSAGHNDGWMGAKYLSVVTEVDVMLGQVLNLIETDTDYVGNTTLILTTDHGGAATSHSDETAATSYTIPFYTWGADVTAGADLYDLAGVNRLDPLTGRPDYTGIQPIRNSDAGNLALALLGLGPIPAYIIGDVNLDGYVDFGDLSLLAPFYGLGPGMTWLNGDFNGDGFVNWEDIDTMAANFGMSPTSGPIGVTAAELAAALGTIPEPSTLMLMTALAVSLAGRNRSRRLAGQYDADRLCRTTSCSMGE